MICVVAISFYALLTHDSLDLSLVKLPAKRKQRQQQKDALQSAWSEGETIRKVSESVWFSIEPKAGRWPEICLLDTGSVEEPVFGGLTICSSTPLRTEQHIILTKSFIDQSPSSHHTLLVLPFLSLVQVGRFFLSTISMIFWFSSHISLSSSEVFHQLILLSGFPPQSPSLGWEVEHQRHDPIWDSLASLRG